ncbi:hypothetical protein P171DRAFT_421734 [Karstenula rhodostoma CBS 690.94]|uniref:Cupin type-2 domain-containing protein n=1 Tax=Karstenula rhodostoma CBS 690.94 TaxID=1392251 RepID=A0A9P4PA70_9PLEO|nr:hypothetical protein P171DRAFT_421734 [Karstenula rhodostoma CBS 690.94]
MSPPKAAPGPVYGPGPISKFPADDLRHARRFVTGHNTKGEGVFVNDDDGAHHRLMVNGNAVSNIIYTTEGNPVDLNGDKDLFYARDNEPGIHIANGSVARLIDFAPGIESPFHRAASIDYGIVVEGTFEFTLDSGESKIMYPGDMSVNRGAMHKWRNVDQQKSGRMLFVLLDITPLKVGEHALGEDLGDLEGEYAGLGQGAQP